MAYTDHHVLGGDGYGMDQVHQQVNHLGRHLVELKGHEDKHAVLQVHNGDEVDLV